MASESVVAAAVTTECGDGNNFLYSPLTVTFASPPSLTGGTAYALVARQAGAGGSGSNFYQLGLIKPSGYGSGNYCTFDGTSWDCPGDGRDAVLSICTSACCTGCTRTQGYWKNNEQAWPVSELLLGTVAYTQAQLLAILGEPVVGNGLISLSHQLIAAKLNQAAGVCVPSSVTTAIADADALIDGLVVPPVGTGFLAPASTSALTTILDTYNKGCTVGGPPHCEAPVVCTVPPLF